MTDAESLKKEIDTIDTNDKIEVQEMEEFLKSEENIKKLWEVMDSNTSPELLQEFESTLKDLCEKLLKLNELENNQEQILDYFLNKIWDKYPEIKENFELNNTINECIKTNQILPTHINQLNEWNKKFWNNYIEKKDKLINLIQTQVNNISRSVNWLIAKNKTPENRLYGEEQIKIIQLWANIKFWENLQINWDRNFGDNWRITNLYIYRQELITRQWVMDYRKQYKMKEFKNLLKIPNLNEQLELLDKDTQNNVMEKFYKFFLKVKRFWMYFEDAIWNERLSNVLTSLINAEKYKNTSIEDYLNKYFLENPLNEEKEELEPLKKELQSYQTIWEYFENIANQYMNTILNENSERKEYNQKLKEIHEENAFQSKIEQFTKIFNEINAWNNSRKSELQKIWNQLLNNSRLQGEQRKEILIMLWWAFSEIETKWETISINYGSRKISWWWNAPSSIKYTPWCKIEVKYNDPEQNIWPWPTGHLNIEAQIYLDGKPINPFTKKRAWYDIKIDKNNTLIIKKLWWDGSELKSTFWDEIYNEYQTTQQELNDKSKKYERISDISAQVESKDWMIINTLTKKEIETVNDETGYTEKYKEYLATEDAICKIQRMDSKANPIHPKKPETPKYTEYHHLNIPWCEGKIVHIKPTEWPKIKTAIQSNGRRMCFNPTNKQKWEIYELTLKDLNIYEKDNWNINLYKINDNWSKWEKINTISAENLKESKRINELKMASISIAPWLKDALNNAQNLSKDVRYISDLYQKFDRSNEKSINRDKHWKEISRGLTDEDVNNIRETAVKIGNQLDWLCKHHNDFVQLKKWLEKRYSWESDLNTEDERRIKSYMNNLDYLINATVEWWDIYNYCESMLKTNNVHSNDEWLERVGWRFRNNWIKTLAAIAWWVAAVCLVPVTWWWSLALLGTAAIMTAWGMAWWFVWQILNEQINIFFEKEIEVETENWTKKVKLKYDDPTSLELAIKWKMSRKDFARETWVQFALWTATTFWCMYAWQLVWWWITKSFESWNLSPKFKAFLERFNRNFKVDNWDPMTDGLFKEIANKIWQNPTSLIKNFNKKFFYEFIDEIEDEVTETWFEEAANAFKWKNWNTWLAIILSWLSTLATAWHCITPWWNMTRIYTENGISLWNIDSPKGKNTLEITLDYSWDYNAIVEYYHKNGFELIDGHLEMKNPDNPKLTNIIHLRETSVPIAKRSLAAQLSWYWISLDSQTWKWYYENMTKIQELELSWKANVSIDPKTKKVTIISWETTLELEQDYFGWKSHKFDVNTTQALSNSRMMDKLSNEINDWNKSEKLQELREEIQKQYKQSTWNEIQLTDEQLLSIIKSHKEAGVIWNLDPAELRQKNTILSETIEDDGTRRFLLEAWFCAKSNLDLRDPLSNLQKRQIENRINGDEKPGLNENQNITDAKNELNKAIKEAENDLEKAKDEWDQEKIEKLEKKLITLKNQEIIMNWNQDITNAKNELNKTIEEIWQKIQHAEKDLEQATKEWDEGKIKKAEKELEKLKNQKIMMDAILTKIEKARIGLNELIEWKPIGQLKDWTVVYAETIEEFLELHQLWMNEWKTTIKDENWKEMGWKRKKLDEGLRMLAVKYYYEAVMKPLWLEIFADPSLTMTDVNESFLDETHSDGFEIKESDKLTLGKWKVERIWNNILDQIAINEWRIKNGSRETENMSIEQKQDYYDTMIKRKINTELWENTTEAKIATELRESAKKHSKWKISPEDQAYLFAMSMKQMADYKTAYPDRSAEQVFRLLNSNQNKLLHQHLWDLNTITSSDHWIKHVLRWNATLAENMFLQLEEKWEDWKTMRDKLYDNNKEKIWQEIQQAEKELKQAKKEWDTEKIKKVEKELERLKNIEWETPEQFKARWRILTRQAIIDHDLWYTNIINKAFDEAWFSKWYITVWDHPLNSTTRIDNNQTFYTILFGEDWYNSLIESVPWHSNAQTQNIPKIADGTASQTEFIRWILSCVDCAWSPSDYKIAHMFAQKGMIWWLCNAYNILNDKSIDPTTKQSLISQALTNLVETIDAMPDSWELALIKESWKKWIDAFLTNKNYQNMSPDEMKDVLWFHFKKFLWAFGVRTEIDPNTWKVKANINKNGGFSIEFALAWGSFEILSEMFWAWVSLKSLIWVCDDYKINDKWPTSKFVERQTQQAINQRKEDKKHWWENNGGKEKPLKEYINEIFSHEPTQAEITEFNKEMKEKAKKKAKEEAREKAMREAKKNQDGRFEGKFEQDFEEDFESEWKDISYKDWIFYTGTRADDASIDFSPDRWIIMKWPNNVEITLNFDGGSYEWFNETAWLFQKIDQKTKERISQIEKEKDNPEILRSIANDVAKDFAQFWEEISDSKDWINTKEEWKPITDKIKEMAKESEVNVEKLIDEINKLRSTYTIKINKVQSSNPTIN